MWLYRCRGLLLVKALTTSIVVPQRGQAFYLYTTTAIRRFPVRSNDGGTGVGKSRPWWELKRWPCLLQPSTTCLSAHNPTEANPKRILSDDIFQRLDELVEERGKARWNGDYHQADQLKEQILAIHLPEDLALVLEDVPRSQGGGSKWKLSYESPLKTQDCASGPSVLQLAHAALGLAISCSQTMSAPLQKQQRLIPLVQQATESLQEWKTVHQELVAQQSTTINPIELDVNGGWREVETTLRGRKAADAAFWFALAGVTSPELFELLAWVCTKELERFGKNSSCRPKDITQMMDRFAAAGGWSLRQTARSELQEIAKECLKAKEQEIKGNRSDEKDLLDLHSDRCLLMLWKFSARQKKQQSFLQSARLHWEKSHRTDVDTDATDEDTNQSDDKLGLLEDGQSIIVWEQCFEDPTRPLVIDVGCGMGISLLGLASLQQEDDPTIWNDLNLPQAGAAYNFLGVDLSGLAIGYAQGIAQRWSLSHSLQFVVESAETLLEQVSDSYPGPVSLCLVQFPTPYRLSTNEHIGGNAQLPKSALEGFMVSPKLLELIHSVLSNKQSSSSPAGVGRLLLQSNCEDVALWVQKAAAQAGFEGASMASPRMLEQVNSLNPEKLPQRTQNWMAMGGSRAVGDKWSSVPLIPRKGSAETEVACRLNETPIHRCVLIPESTAVD